MRPAKYAIGEGCLGKICVAALAILGALFARPALAKAACNVRGLEPLTVAGARYVLVGEHHGTAESPAEFGDFVCALSATGRRVVVALEFPQAYQGSLDSFLASDGGRAAIRAFRSGPPWSNRPGDGRTSAAMLALVERLRSLYRAGDIQGVRYLIPPAPQSSAFSPDLYEETMAAGIKQAASFYPGALVVALIGNAHATKGAISLKAIAYKSAATHLPNAQVVLIFLAGQPGWAWDCRSPSPADCGPHTLDDGMHAPRGIQLGPIRAGFDAVMSTGAPSTASPPA